MRPIIGIVFVIAIGLTVIEVTKGDDFCQSYRENNYEISYGFRRFKPTNNYSFQFIFIDKKYWRLEFIDSTEDNNRRVKISSLQSQTSNWFGKEYSMAFCIWKSYKRTCTPGLMKAKSSSIEWAELNETSVTVLDTIKHLNTTNITFTKNIEPKFAYTSSGQLAYGRVVVFHQTMDDKNDKYWELIKFSDEREPEIPKLEEKSCSTPHTVHKMMHRLPIIAILGQFSEEDYRNNMGTNPGSGDIVLFKDEYRIKYCWTNNRRLSSQCESENLMELIACNPKNKDTKEEKKYLILILIVVVIAVVIIGLIVIIVILIKSLGSEGTVATRVSSAFTDPSKSAIEQKQSKSGAPLKTLSKKTTFTTLSTEFHK